jgi:hypothetical protein
MACRSTARAASDRPKFDDHHRHGKGRGDTEVGNETGANAAEAADATVQDMETSVRETARVEHHPT